MINLTKFFQKAISFPTQVKRYYYNHATLPDLVEKSRIIWPSATGKDFLALRKSTLDHVAMSHKPVYGVGAYSYKLGDGPPLLYASCYAALTRHLYGNLDLLSTSERTEWIRYIHEYQCDDGLFRDPIIDVPLAEKCDWWGWRNWSG